MRIAVVGTGYVGLVTGACLAAIGHEVICVDRLVERVELINHGIAPFYEPRLADLVAEMVAAGRLCASVDLASAVRSSALSMIAVGTPGDGERIDLSQIRIAAEDIGRALREHNGFHVVTVKSTVVPGTTDGLVRSTLEAASGKVAGKGFGLCMNPEFLREGSAVEDFMEPDRIVLGQFDESSGAVLRELYTRFDCPKLVVGLRNAEFIKYASNLLLATLISYSNEIATLCEATPEADVELVMNGVHLDRRLSPVVDGKRISPGILTYLRAGMGFGGSCLPKDVNALRTFARERQLPTRLLDSVIEINRCRPDHLIHLAERAMGGLVGRTVTVLGLAFKPGTDDLRDSPAVTLINRLLDCGVMVRAYDPMCNAQAERLYAGRITLTANTAEAVRGSDAVIIATAWPEFVQQNWSTLVASMARPILVDGRNQFCGAVLPENLHYLTIGTLQA